MLGFSGLNGILHHGVTADIQIAILKAVKCLQQSGLTTEIATIKGLENSTEIAFSGIARLRQLPLLMSEDTSVKQLLMELVKSYCKKSKYTKEGLTFELLRRTNAFMTPEKLIKYKEERQKLKEEIIVSRRTKENLLICLFVFRCDQIDHDKYEIIRPP